MDDTQARAAIIKQQRRKIIDVLKLLSPASATFETISHILPEIEWDNLKRDLDYFVKKGLVHWINEAPNMVWKAREFDLTATGIETADKINIDPALEP